MSILAFQYGYFWKITCIGHFYFIPSFFPLAQYNLSFIATILLNLFCDVIGDFIWVLCSFSCFKGFFFFFSSLTVCYASLFLFPIQFSCLSFSAFGEPYVLSYLLNMGVFSSLSSSFCSVSCPFFHFFGFIY